MKKKEKVAFIDFKHWISDSEREKGSVAAYEIYDGLTFREALKLIGEEVEADKKNALWDTRINAEEFRKLEEEFKEMWGE